MATRTHDIRVGTVQTTNGSPTTIITYTLPDNTVAQFMLNVVGDLSGGTNCAGYIRRFVYKRQGGAATIVGTVDSAVFPDKEDDNRWDVTVTTATNDVVMQVTGDVGITVDWFAYLEVVLYTP